MSDNWKSIGELANEAVAKRNISESAYRALVSAISCIVENGESRFTASDICSAIITSPTLNEATTAVMLLEGLDSQG